MNTIWQTYLATRGGRIQAGQVVDFGEPGDELIAAQNATVLVSLDHLALVECAGEDAKSFLHNQLTSDVNHLAINTAQHSSWCTAKGRMQASFILYRQDADYRALLSADLLETTVKRLQLYVLRSKVTLRDLTENQVLLGVAGVNAEAALQMAALPRPESDMATIDFADGTVIRLEARRFIIIVKTSAAPQLWKKLSVKAVSAGVSAWQWLDIQSGIVRITAATKEEFVPQMANVDKIGGVSFHKGCYPGQEVVARAQYLGKIKRHLYRIRTDGFVAAGTPLYQTEDAGQACGLIANAAPAPDSGYAALAIIKESVAESEKIHLKIPGIVISEIEPVIA